MKKLHLGMGLLELLICLLLSSIIMTAVVSTYISVKQHYLDINIELERAFDLQLVSDLIRQSVRHAGFTPCLGITHLQFMDTRNGRVTILPIEIQSGAEPRLQINRMSEQYESVIKVLNSTQVLIPNQNALDKEHPILIADCYYAEVARIEHITQSKEGQILTLDQSLSFPYQMPIYIGEWIEERFIIHSHNNTATLFYSAQHTDELTADVHSLSAHLLSTENHTVLQVSLGLTYDNLLQLDTMVRTP